MAENQPIKEKPLKGIKVLEMGTLLAGPFAARILAEFGAEVIKVEAPGTGDPLRDWRLLQDGTSLWWYVQSRNKKSITLNLREHEGQEIVLRLAEKVDIVIENFRPGTLDKWNIGYDRLKEINPKIIMVSVSGYGQDGPYRDKAGFGSIGEALGGVRYITGHPDRPPVRVGISLGDTVAGLYGAIGALMAVYHRDINGLDRGQRIDVALYEAVFSLMESTLPEYDRFGVVRERTGTMLPGVAPSNTYKCADGRYIVIGGNSDSIYKRFMNMIGRPDMAEDERFKTNSGRAKHAGNIDGVIEEWTSRLGLEEALQMLDQAQVPAGAIYSIREIVNDPHFNCRGMIQEVDAPGGKLKIPGVVPKMSETPGGTEWLGPKLGEHNGEVYRGLLGLSPEKIDELSRRGII